MPIIAPRDYPEWISNLSTQSKVQDADDRRQVEVERATNDFDRSPPPFEPGTPFGPALPPNFPPTMTPTVRRDPLDHPFWRGLARLNSVPTEPNTPLGQSNPGDDPFYQMLGRLEKRRPAVPTAKAVPSTIPETRTWRERVTSVLGLASGNPFHFDKGGQDVIDVLDVTGETTFDLIRGKRPTLADPLVAGSWRESASWDKALNQAVYEFNERPFVQQLLVGALDPLVVGGAIKATVKIGAGGGLKVGRVLAGTIDPAPDAAEVQRNMVDISQISIVTGQANLPRADLVRYLPTNIEVMDSHVPPASSSNPFLRTAIRVADPLANVKRLELFSTDEVIERAKLIDTKLANVAEGNVSVIMTHIRESLGDPAKIFNTPDGAANRGKIVERVKTGWKRLSKDELPPDGLYAYGVTHYADGTVLKEPEFIGNIMENPDRYDLSTVWAGEEGAHKWIRSVSELVDTMKAQVELEGIKVADVKDLYDLQNYFPRVVGDERKLVAQQARTRAKRPDPLEQRRVVEEMTKEMMEKGYSYHPSLDALEVYFKAGYRHIITHRRHQNLEPLRDVKKIPDDIKEAFSTAKQYLKKMEKLGQILPAMRQGMPLARGQWRVLRNAFPDYTDQINRLRELRPEDFERVRDAEVDALLKDADVRPDEFWNAYRDRLGLDYGPQIDPNVVSPSATTRSVDELIDLHKKQSGDTRSSTTQEHMSFMYKREAERLGEAANRITVRGLDNLNDSELTYLSDTFPSMDFTGGVDVKVLLDNIEQERRAVVKAMEEAEGRALGLKEEQLQGGMKLDADERALRGMDEQFVGAQGYQLDRELMAGYIRKLFRGPHQSRDATWPDQYSKSLKAAMAEGRRLIQQGRMTLEGIREVELAEFANMFPGKKRHPKRMLSTKLETDTEQISAINAALRDVGANVKARHRVRKAIQSRNLAFMEKDKLELIDDLLAAQSSLFDSAKDNFSMARRIHSDYGARVRKDTPTTTTTKVTGAETFFDNEDAIAINKKFGIEANSWLEGPYQVASLGRAARSVVDIGTWALHGLIIAFDRPESWAKAVMTSAKALFDPVTGKHSLDKYVTEHSESVLDMLRAGVVFRSSDVTKALDDGGWLGAFVVRELDRIPPGGARGAAKSGPFAINKTFRTFSNSFEAFLDVAKVEYWEALKHLGVNPKSKAELGAFVNKVTGTLPGTSLGLSRTQQQLEGAFAFYAPGYFRASSALMGDTFRRGLRGDLARRAVGRLFAGLLFTHIGLSLATGQEPNVDPSKPGQFLTIEVGGQRVGLGNKITSLTTLTGKIVRKGFEDPNGFVNWEFWDNEAYRENPFLQGLRAQMSLPAGVAIDNVTGADFLGRSVPGYENMDKRALYNLGKLSPFWLEAGIEAGNGERNMMDRITAATFSSSVTGFGGRTHPVPPSVVYKRMEEEMFQKEFGVSPDEMREKEPLTYNTRRQELFEKEPRLRDLFQRSQENKLKAESFKPMMTYTTKVSDVHQEWADKTDKIGDTFVNALDDVEGPKQFRNSLKIAGANRAGRLQQLRVDNPELTEELKKYQEEKSEDDPYRQAINEFLGSLNSFLTDDGVLYPDGRVSRSAVAELKRDLNEEYGKGTVERISSDLRERRENMSDAFGNPIKVHPAVLEYYASYIILDEYWSLYEEVVPEELWVEYEQYDELSDDEKTRVMRNSSSGIQFRLFDGMVDQKKQVYKLSHPDVDLMLWKFYGIQPTHPKNLGKKVEHYFDVLFPKKERLDEELDTDS